MAKRTKKSAATPPAASAGRYAELKWDQLTPSLSVNARGGDHSEDGIAELAALIASQGLLQPLLVRSTPSASIYDVVDGERRRQAIGKLILDGLWPDARPVPCIVRDGDDASALETSLVANISREPMHPVRELEVFAELHGQGADVATIAQRYGVSERVVKQRLALGGLAPEIREAWRAGEINAETAQAFAVCRDVARQSKVFADLRKQRRLWSHEVRQRFVKDKPRLNDPRIAFVGGLDAYKAAGGKVVESLFKGDGYLEDGELLERLVAERQAAKCAELVADGWSFAVSAAEIKGQAHWSWQKLQPGKTTFTAEEKAKLDALEQEEAQLEALDALDDEQSDRIDAIIDERNRVEAEATSRAYTKAQKAKSGCVVDGDTILYGLVRPIYDGTGLSKQERAARDSAADDDAEPGGLEEGHREEDDAGDAHISSALLLSLSEQQTVAAAKALASAPGVALAIAVAGLNSYNTGPVKITAEGFRDVRGSHDHAPFAEALAALSGTDLTVELARAVSRTLDLRRYTSGPAYTSGFQSFDVAGIEALVGALPGNVYLAAIREMFEPEDYFRRSPAALIRAAIAEMTDGKRQLGEKVKKSDLVAIAAELAGPTGWLPPELRHPDYVLQLTQDHSAGDGKPKRSRRKAA